MLEDYSNNNSETVQQLIKIEDYMKLSKEDRQKHIDLTSECKFHYFKRDWNYRGVIKKEGDLYGKASQINQAKRKLLDELNIEDFGGSKIHVCHLCDCNSYSDRVCINPLHLYFGTVSENNLDKPLELRQKCGKIWGKIGGKIGGKKATANMSKEQLSERGKKGGKTTAELGKGGFKQKVKCPHCDKTGIIANMHRWHFDNCKFKSISTDVSNLIPETVSTNLE